MDSTPLLFVDIDGVLNPYAAPTCPEGYSEYDFFPGEEPVRLCVQHQTWLSRLATSFDLIWASGWKAEERKKLLSVLDLPSFSGALPLPEEEFDPREKIPAVETAALGKPLAWLDDVLTPEAWAWAEQRSAPTLLVEIDPRIGLTQAAVDELEEWANSL